MDVVELRGLRALGHHGVLPGEQDRPQPFEVDLEVEADLSRAGATDDLADTADYGALVAAAVRVVTDERWNLLERMAQRVGEEVLAADGRVEAVTVTVRKLRPPVPLDMASAGVRVRRMRGVEPAPARRRAFLGLGANLGDRRRTLREAVAALPDVVAVSPLYETEPVGGPEGQPPYLNVVVELLTGRSPRALLEWGQRLEAEAERDRDAEERFGPRPLDVDVLWVDDMAVDEPDLVVPHPRMFDRRFVLAPLADLAPELLPEGSQEAAAGTVRRVGRL
ncbi:MAG: 2-amino-4-hydroxy-6-hydroxymethyldihydropteridine diphosphokinase [Actinomycetota bacterium]|nr:2-amino-4-hydroxy-6-hydroxymethyldihydropteridine diphosphokinase [Actinomycetota bacterium]